MRSHQKVGAGLRLAIVAGASAGIAVSLMLLSGDRNASGQTVGKKVAHIQVRSLVSGGRLGTGKGFLRTFISWIPLVNVLDVLWPLWDDRQQALHDKAAGSVVIKLPR